jgi:putative tryptophan/tyrosine transport system substrate-binding protein
MRRRDFISLVGGAAAAWPFVTLAQQQERVRRIGALSGIAAADPETKVRFAAFLSELERRGWSEGRNLRIEYRFASGSSVEMRKAAEELVAFGPDVMLAIGSYSLDYLLQVTRSVPIVFAVVIDPVGGGYVESLSQPGGNVTGFMNFDYDLSAKWLELLKQISPGVTRAAVIRDPVIASGIGQFAVIQSVSRSVGIEVTPVNPRDRDEIERSLNKFVRRPNGGVVVTAGPFSVLYREFIATLADRYKLPTIYPERFFAASGGLVSYGPDFVEQHRLAATYVDRILRGEKPADLPVQAPNKYSLVINLKTAKSLGLTVPPALVARADEVIE